MKILKTRCTLFVIEAFAILCALSCVSKEANLGKSQIDTSTPTISDMDRYVRDNFVKPYNINVSYKFNEYEVEIGRVLYPPKTENVKPVLEIIQKVWIEPYNQVAPDLIKRIAPRLFVLVGGYNYNPSGTITLGVAEGGVKITLFNVDQLDTKNKSQVSRYLHTAHHEYTHLLNQTKPYVAAFREVTPNYTSNWYDSTDAEALELGYITPYARTNDVEDFAEMTSTILGNTKADYDNRVNGIKDQNAKNNIRKKEALVVEYFSTEYGIDLYKLQELVTKATDKFVSDAQKLATSQSNP